MHPVVHQEFERRCRARNVGGDILEIGAIPSADTLLLLPALRNARRRIGVNLDGPHRIEGLDILQGDGHQLSMFRAGEFDAVLCNATLEHDPEFWRTLSEIRRVLKPGGVALLGVPGYDQPPRGPLRRCARWLRRLPGWRAEIDTWSVATPTLAVHNYPADYYRFSVQAVRDVFFRGFKDVEISAVMQPPRIIGSGVLPG